MSPRKKYSSYSTKPRHKWVDLHMHSTLSDGMLDVKDLVDLAVQNGQSCISITDHDDIESYNVAEAYAKEKGIELIPGVEISAVHNGKDIHILGYFFDVTNLALNLELREQTRRRLIRARAIIRKLKILGVSVSIDKVLSYAKGKSVGRPHIAMAMVDEEYVPTFNDAFRLYLGDEGKAFVAKKGLSTEQAIRLIENAGGIAVMAHPYKTGADEIIEEMVEYGLQGIETYCASQTGSTGRKYRELAKRYNLICTGGSDFHNPVGSCMLGSLKIPYSVVEHLRDRMDQTKAVSF